MGEATNEVGPVSELNDPAIRRASTAGGSHTSEDSPDAAQIRSDIEHTRADLSDTINALQEKLDPTRIAEQVKEQALRLKRAARKPPLLLSSVTGQGLPEVLRALMAVIDAARTSAADREPETAWYP